MKKYGKAIDSRLRLIKVAGDGNCLFRALARADARYGEEDHRRLRLECVEYVWSHSDYFSEFLPDGVADFSPHMITDWCSWMEANKEYGDNYALLAAANVLGQPIVVVDKRTRNPVHDHGQQVESRCPPSYSTNIMLATNSAHTMIYY